MDMNNPHAQETLSAFYQLTHSELLCSKITGRKFEEKSHFGNKTRIRSEQTEQYSSDKRSKFSYRDNLSKICKGRSFSKESKSFKIHYEENSNFYYPYSNNVQRVYPNPKLS